MANDQTPGSESLTPSAVVVQQTALDQLILRATQKLAEVEEIGLSVTKVMSAAEVARDSAQKAMQDAVIAKTQAESERGNVTKLRISLEAEQAKLISDSGKLAPLVAQATADSRKIQEITTATVASQTAVNQNVQASTQSAASIKLASEATEVERLKAVKSASDALTAKISSEAEQARASAAATAALDEKQRVDTARAGVDAAVAAVTVLRDQVTAIKATIDLLLANTEASKKTADTCLASIKDSESSAATSAALSIQHASGVSEAQSAADGELASIKEILSKAKFFRDAAEQAAQLAKEAHNLSTTVGLAGAFNQRALQNTKRTWGWSGALVAALVAAATIGWFRYIDLEKYIATKPEQWALMAQLVLALFGVGAPVWLAWVSTRMVSKSFALTEDYAYKAALSTAYVGFRDQAQKLGDPIFEQRLFAAAVTQLDANPVRLLDSAHPGSPLQDLLQQSFIQDAMEVQSFKKGLVDWFNERFKTKFVLPASNPVQPQAAMVPNVQGSVSPPLQPPAVKTTV